ncbi:MAG: hypothetical protein DMG38_19195 [Acidobacteria bacterium]|nr:MAG: hypothetical protein DMG38_19195 [Acidobacteriota bacterium]
MPSTICRLDALSSLSRTLRNLPILWLILAVLLLAVPSWPQQAPRPEARPDIPPSEPASRQTPAQNPAPGEPPVTLPAGTQLALVLTHPLDSKTMHRGDTVFAETTAPVPVDDQVVIPVGASVQGKVERLTRQGNRAELLVQSVSIALPDDYVLNIAGPVEITSGEGTARRNPSDGAKAGAGLAPLVGSGLGTVIGLAAHTTETTNFAGMTMTSSTPKGVAIGAITGMAAGTAVSVILLARSHHFYVAEGAPLDMILPHPAKVAERAPSEVTRLAAAKP